MEIKIQNGAVCLNGLGLPETLSGLEALLQRAHNRLNAVRGAFPYDRSLGSRLPYAALSADHGAEEALGFAREALRDCPEIPAARAAVAPDAVTVFVETPLGEGSVTVHRKKEGDEDDV